MWTSQAIGPAEKPVDIVLQSGKQVVRSFVFWGIEHNIDVMHRLGTERQFGKHSRGGAERERLEECPAHI